MTTPNRPRDPRGFLDDPDHLEEHRNWLIKNHPDVFGDVVDVVAALLRLHELPDDPSSTTEQPPEPHEHPTDE